MVIHYTTEQTGTIQEVVKPRGGGRVLQGVLSNCPHLTEWIRFFLTDQAIRFVRPIVTHSNPGILPCPNTRAKP
ncbi:hypothetical protein CEXT_266791 [Caerostris extrusa]|uniref:Uncharacterized protein n=1 Tax=Caerostris extrusa TaxID=172846 RepID=A0AAV4WI06_CAEEX|nr:hypothetical protein CEXT_266791 [Caerostris extrusa]